ncbi:hypothetical protein A1Q1_04017 [Trichosporon asahii var. asahii CBS 2479]|uniref:Uncharacterized protein n=1 Tax=Trichosporon asahii var. asahii (strain ATCC 90039 / CBS 2479 / JCM 2466 / KCTC 7840 / NBRC 103889/ NCYC 2677 / UAMH 7654) TaxID=1186058 RepID=J6ERL9_TRIAS|nr:hypothetical protein A1Q1_04017 [Trichosporon asahii var. asahii CBS 2479]EJT47159.1 hypothetical protein A1Q1_04017 [Trichosporon asahii var. asahii CBS 2479]
MPPAMDDKERKYILVHDPFGYGPWISLLLMVFLEVAIGRLFNNVLLLYGGASAGANSALLSIRAGAGHRMSLSLAWEQMSFGCVREGCAISLHGDRAPCGRQVSLTELSAVALVTIG